MLLSDVLLSEVLLSKTKQPNLSKGTLMPQHCAWACRVRTDLICAFSSLSRLSFLKYMCMCM